MTVLMTEGAVLDVEPLSFPWKTRDPFLFCAHHHDAYPAGNDRLGPAAPLAGRRLGMDFDGRDGWNMYHGQVVPGFPQHPHRGFETVTIVRRGLIDHSDSLGAAARFGRGDVQWVTAGRGIVHSEMFPLLDEKASNPLELFQIWLNLPKAKKFVDAHFSMLWNEAIPKLRFEDADGRATEVAVIAGKLGDTAAPAPPPASYASRPDADIAIWTLALEPQARWVLPPARQGTNRTLYFHRGASLSVAGSDVPPYSAVVLEPETAVELAGGPDASDLLLLQGRPIGEPVVQYGPFVMNAPHEIKEAILDYQRTHFGGWPWPSDDPVHPREAGRFARHADGRIERR